MHKSGTIAIVAIIVLGICSVLFTTKLLAIRNKWLAEIEDRQAKLAAQATDLAQTQLALSAAEEEVQAMAHVWGEVFPAPNSGPLPQGGIQIGAGAGTGLGLREKTQGKDLPLVFAFSQNEQGQAQYEGEFQLVDVDVNQSSARPLRPLLPGEPRGQGFYRLRTNLPSAWRSTLTNLVAERTVADDLLRSQKQQLETLTGHIKDSQLVLERRLGELNGTATPPPGAGPQLINGLVQTLRTSEQERNQLLAEVDRLRKSLDEQYVEMRRILNENVQKKAQLEQQTSGGAPSSTASITF